MQSCGELHSVCHQRIDMWTHAPRLSSQSEASLSLYNFGSWPSKCGGPYGVVG